MNTKIIASLAMILVVGAVATAGTIAYFSDEEVSTGNTFTAGTIDIAVNSENPWNQDAAYVFDNLEPSQSKDINVTLKNVGTNPVVIWKKVTVVSIEGGVLSEPECFAEGGTAYDATTTACTGNTAVNDIDNQFVYSMKIGGTDNIKKDWGVKVSDINNLWIPLGRLSSGSELAVDQNYYFNELAGNVYQGDKMTVNVTFYAEQLDAPGPSYVSGSRGLVLDNKNVASGTWEPIVGDGTWGILKWDASGNFTMKGWGVAGANYRSVYWNGTTETNMGTGDTAVASGTVTITGTYPALNTNPNGAKYWLRDAAWSNTNTLWESNLVSVL